jgi:hypothetical protein
VPPIVDTSEVIEKLNALNKRFEGFELAHRKLLERVMDLELRERHRLPSKDSGPPPKMDNLRPAYRSRRSLINEAQGILDAKKVPEKKAVDKKGNVVD